MLTVKSKIQEFKRKKLTEKNFAPYEFNMNTFVSDFFTMNNGRLGIHKKRVKLQRLGCNEPWSRQVMIEHNGPLEVLSVNNE